MNIWVKRATASSFLAAGFVCAGAVAAHADEPNEAPRDEQQVDPAAVTDNLMKHQKVNAKDCTCGSQPPHATHHPKPVVDSGARLIDTVGSEVSKTGDAARGAVDSVAGAHSATPKPTKPTKPGGSADLPLPDAGANLPGMGSGSTSSAGVEVTPDHDGPLAPAVDAAPQGTRNVGGVDVAKVDDGSVTLLPSGETAPQHVATEPGAYAEIPGAGNVVAGPQGIYLVPGTVGSGDPVAPGTPGVPVPEFDPSTGTTHFAGVGSVSVNLEDGIAASPDVSGPLAGVAGQLPEQGFETPVGGVATGPEGVSLTPPALSPELPGLPGLPGEPGSPEAPGLPGLPGLPGFPEMPVPAFDPETGSATLPGYGTVGVGQDDGVVTVSPDVSGPFDPLFGPLPEATFGVPGVDLVGTSPEGVAVVPSVDGGPGVPEAPGLPGLPGLPDVPGVPDGPGTPGVPETPGLPDVPDTPGFPGLSVPEFDPGTGSVTFPGVGSAIVTLEDGVAVSPDASGPLAGVSGQLPEQGFETPVGGVTAGPEGVSVTPPSLSPELPGTPDLPGLPGVPVPAFDPDTGSATLPGYGTVGVGQDDGVVTVSPDVSGPFDPLFGPLPEATFGVPGVDLVGTSPEGVAVVPSVDGGPGVPEAPGLPGLPGLPDVPGVPDGPGTPGVPETPGLPDVPDTPGFPGLSVPEFDPSTGTTHFAGVGSVSVNLEDGIAASPDASGPLAGVAGELPEQGFETPVGGVATGPEGVSLTPPALSPELPGLPGLPGEPDSPEAPGLPGLPGLPGFPEMPVPAFDPETGSATLPGYGTVGVGQDDGVVTASPDVSGPVSPWFTSFPEATFGAPGVDLVKTSPEGVALVPSVDGGPEAPEAPGDDAGNGFVIPDADVPVPGLGTGGIGTDGNGLVIAPETDAVPEGSVPEGSVGVGTVRLFSFSSSSGLVMLPATTEGDEEPTAAVPATEVPLGDAATVGLGTEGSGIALSPTTDENGTPSGPLASTFAAAPDGSVGFATRTLVTSDSSGLAILPAADSGDSADPDGDTDNAGDDSANGDVDADNDGAGEGSDTVNGGSGDDTNVSATSTATDSTASTTVTTTELSTASQQSQSQTSVQSTPNAASIPGVLPNTGAGNQLPLGGAGVLLILVGLLLVRRREAITG